MPLLLPNTRFIRNFCHYCFTAVSSVYCSSLHLLSVDLFLRCAVFVLISEAPPCELCPALSSPAAEGIGAELCRVCGDQKSTMNESSSARAGESTWSSGQQMKMENCYHLWVPFKYMQAGRGGQVMMDAPCPRRCWYDQRNTWAPTPATLPPSPIHHRNRQTDVCRSPTSTENCPCAKLPLGWEILFICCTSPIMFLSPSRLWVLFIKIAGILTYFSAQKLDNNNNKKKKLPSNIHASTPAFEGKEAIEMKSITSCSVPVSKENNLQRHEVESKGALELQKYRQSVAGLIVC